MTHLAQRNKTNDCGPFETWRNPATGEESQFISFPVVNGRIAQEVTLASEEHGQYMEWTFSLDNIAPSVPESVTMRRRQRERPQAPQAVKIPAKTAVIYRTSPRFFVAAYVVISLAVVLSIILRLR